MCHDFQGLSLNLIRPSLEKTWESSRELGLHAMILA